MFALHKVQASVRLVNSHIFIYKHNRLAGSFAVDLFVCSEQFAEQT